MKNNTSYSAGLNPDSGRVNVFKRNLRGNVLGEHYANTINDLDGGLSQQVHEALSDAVAKPAITSQATRNFIYMPTSRCNMGCTYCGQEHGTNNSPEAVDEAFFQRVSHAIQHPDISHVHVAWFGGEPLLAYLKYSWSFAAHY